MRHVYDSQMIGHLWANQSQSDARNKQGNFSFRGPSIFSYAAEIARIVTNEASDRAVMIADRSWSVTTSRHQSLARRALGNVQRFHVIDLGVFHAADMDPEYEGHDRNRDHYADKIAGLLGKAKRARKYQDSLLGSVLSVAYEANAYALFFGLEWRLGGDLNAIATRHAAWAAAKAAREDKEQRRADERLAVAIEQWKAGENVSVVRASDIYLRVRVVCGPPDSEDTGKFVETSRGARFPVEDAIKAWRLIVACRARGEGWERNGHIVRMGSFQLDAIDAEGNVVAGCHKVKFEESERLARLLGLEV